MIRDELLQLPVTVNLATAARALGIGRNLAQRLAAAGDFPCDVHKLGRTYRVVTQGPDGLLAACGIDPSPALPLSRPGAATAV